MGICDFRKATAVGGTGRTALMTRRTPHDPAVAGARQRVMDAWGRPEHNERLDHVRWYESSGAGGDEEGEEDLALKYLKTVHRKKYAKAVIKRIRAGRGEIDHPADESHALANDEAIEHYYGPIAACHAVSLVATGEVDNAFCFNSFPGNFVGTEGRHGLTPGDAPHSLLNTACIAAAFAKKVFKIDRVAIIDLDPRGGHGSREIVAAKKKGMMYANVCAERFAPPTNWRFDAKYPGNVSIASLPLDADYQQFRVAFGSVFDEVRAYDPQMIVISAGFPDDEESYWRTTAEDFHNVVDTVVAFAKSSEECNGAIVSVLEGSVRDVDLLADYVNDHIHALTGVPLPVPPPVVPSSTTSETSFREPTPPPPPDDTAWVDPTAAYYDKQLLQATEENILLRERLADLENVIRDGDDEEDKVDARCRELEAVLEGELETLRPLKEALSPHHARVAQLESEIAAEERRVSHMEDLIARSTENKMTWGRLIRSLEANLAENERKGKAARVAAAEADLQRQRSLRAHLKAAERETAEVKGRLDAVTRMQTALDSKIIAAHEQLKYIELGMRRTDDEIEVVYDDVKLRRELDGAEMNATVRSMLERDLSITKTQHINLLRAKIESTQEAIAALEGSVAAAVREAALSPTKPRRSGRTTGRTTGRTSGRASGRVSAGSSAANSPRGRPRPRSVMAERNGARASRPVAAKDKAARSGGRPTGRRQPAGQRGGRNPASSSFDYSYEYQYDSALSSSTVSSSSSSLSSGGDFSGSSLTPSSDGRRGRNGGRGGAVSASGVDVRGRGGDRPRLVLR